MKKVTLLGCGFHGRGIAYHLAASSAVALRVMDRDAELAAAVGTKAGVPWGTVDVSDAESLRAALEGAQVVINAVGPYHLSALGIIEAAIDAGVHYVDMSDDHEVAEALLLDPSWDAKARRSGSAILVHCGVVPGLSGMLVAFASRQLERVDRVAVRFGWNYSREYPAAIQHFLRINSGNGLQFVEGRHIRMGPFEGREVVEFLDPVGPTEVFFTGIPDPISIPKFLSGVITATAKGAFYQEAANRLLQTMILWGFASYQAPTTGWPRPMDYLMTYIASEAGARYFDIPRRDVPLAVRVDVEGSRSGSVVNLRYEAHDYSRRATTTFTALAVLAVANGELSAGVHAPEAWPDPEGFLHQLQLDPHIRMFECPIGELVRPLQ